MSRHCRFFLPVFVATSAITYIYLSTVFIFIDVWFGLTSSPGILNAIAFTSVTFMCILNYVVAILADPGRGPATFMPDIEDSQTPIHEIKRKGGDLRYCQKCAHYKPARAHHCRVCRRCVLRMVCQLHCQCCLISNILDDLFKMLGLDCKDHHCIWINNSVGHANYKVFFIFVLYAVLGCIYSLILLVGSIYNDAEKDGHQSKGLLRNACVISGLLLVPLSVALIVLLGWHIYLLLQNKTTIEYYEGIRALYLAEKGGNVFSNFYDLGAYENLTSALGPSVISWVCSTSKHIGSGLRFRTSFDRAAGASMGM